MSGPITAGHAIDREVEDLCAVVKDTKANYIFGHSFGGVISLQAAKRLDIQRIAVYEPPVSVNNSIPDDWIEEFEASLSRGRKLKAMATFLKALPPPDLAKMPQWTLFLIAFLVKFGERKKPKETRILNLLQTIPPDMRIVKELERDPAAYRGIESDVLLMRGTKSQAFFQDSVTVLGELLPKVQTTIFEGFDHYSPEEKVGEIATHLKNFFRGA
jgi:pimeloyl-ACP methyl ester carboxylesterase